MSVFILHSVTFGAEKFQVDANEGEGCGGGKGGRGGRGGRGGTV